jgi:MFS superfamily sulfate permease-like transporter
MFAYGVANVAAGLTGSLVTGNSASRTAAMDATGSRSQLPSLVAAGTIALIMLFFTDVLAFLPNAALAGIVANAVLSLIEVGEFRELWRLRRADFWIAAVCMLSVLVLGPLRAVIIAFLMSTIDVIRRASRPGTWVLREAPDGSHFSLDEPDHVPDLSGLVIYRFGAPLYFANASLFVEEIERLGTQGPSPVRWFVLDAEAIVDVDTTGAEALREALKLLASHGVTFAMTRANQPLVSLLARYELLELIGEDRLYPTNRHAAAAFRGEAGQPAPNTSAEEEGNAHE